MGFCRECGIELEENGICDSCKERLGRIRQIIEKDECPECGSKLNGQKVCSNCKYNIELGYKEVNVMVDDTVKFGAMDPVRMNELKDPNLRINTMTKKYCPVCGSPLDEGAETCSSCNFPIKK